MLQTDEQGDNQDKPYCKDTVEEAHQSLIYRAC